MNKQLLELLKSDPLGRSLSPEEAERLGTEVLPGLSGLKVYPASITPAAGNLFFLGRQDVRKYLGIVSQKDKVIPGFEGSFVTTLVGGREIGITVAAASAINAARLQEILPFLKPRPLGLKKTAGCGDRLGLATPGHVRAVRKTNLDLIPAQQSVRENERTGRSPGQVLQDAMWGLFQEGWTKGYGADADHLKTKEDIDSFVSAGYTFYTIDPGEFVDNDVDRASAAEIQRKAEALPWPELETTPDDLLRSLAQRPIDLGGFQVSLSREEILGAAAKYGRVVLHTSHMYRHLIEAISGRPFEFEVSVDETDSVTTLPEHIYLASELKRLGVKWVSLAPRYVGSFEKGVDYIGDLKEFEASFARHAAVAGTFGPYKLSLHSGSDKFSIYPVAARLAGGLIHLKTAGTSYLEALRAVAGLEPGLFREILAFALTRYPEDRATYHVSAEVSRIPEPTALQDRDLPGLLEDFHAREVLHVTYGSILKHSEIRDRFFQTLEQHEEEYTQVVERHFDKHFSLLS